MRVLITGGAGYIGSALTNRLLADGHKVTVLDNFMYSQNSLLEACKNPNFKVVKGDARREELLGPLLKDCDFAIPLACLTGAPLCKANPIDAENTIVGAIETLLRIAPKDVKVIYPTTNSGYGIGEGDKWCDETSPLRPVSLYGKLKVKAEELVLERGNSVTFRLATVFGVSPRMRLDLMVNDFVHKAFTDSTITLFEGHFKRNFLYIGDAVEAFVFAINNFENVQGEAYNVGLNEANLTKKELCLKIKERIPSFIVNEAEFAKDPDQRDYLVSNNKILEKGFEAKTGLEQGIDELIKCYGFLSGNPHRNI